MKQLSLALIVAGLVLAPQAYADEALAKAKNCRTCHVDDKKLIGPAYQEVSAKYKGDETAAATLAKKIKDGGVGVWGKVPMPPNPLVSEAEAETLAKWVLTK